MIATFLAMAANLMAAQAGTPARPAHSLQPLESYFSSDDYPAQAQRRGAEGIIHFTVIIDRLGTPVRCIVDRSSNDPDLDRTTCDILTSRVRFRPARDARGRAVESRFSNRVRWVLPETATLPFEPVRYVTTMHAAPGGGVSCSTNGPHDPHEHGSPDECGTLAGTGAGQILRRITAEATITAIYGMVPEGSPVPAGEASGYGSMFARSEALLTVAPDGRVTECQVVRDEHPEGRGEGISSEARAALICGAFPRDARIFDAARDGAQTRRMRVFNSLYFLSADPPTP